MYSIPKYKTGNCTECPSEDVPCVKVGKNLVCLTCRQYQKADKQAKRPATKKPQDSRANLIEDLDALTSKIVRLRACIDGFCTCYTCNVRIPYNESQNSHFIKRGNLSLRFDLKYNCQCSCQDCNERLGGNLKKYAENLELECPGIVEQLTERGREVEIISNDELKMMVVDYRAKLKSLLK